ncbi:molybdenum ABC transporter ATP-binding protein [Paracoccus suum]|uniref:Molybdenum ABC transporter ATP-binding protein n=1 Tax=Paracoccus suum TaxID=2259340 RepID=A0A344PN96_9RHOB|nr:molybdenum ABC transporter ATP-binding protein [Paracoccus suum]AXC50851.1 molybdenum ABC transporter ATP-binding protein [Paracoccus suum]
MLQVTLHHKLPGFTLDAAFDSPPGVTSIFGHSGAGKTSIVNAVAGLLRPDVGRIVLDGTVLTDTKAGIMVPAHRRRIGYVFQDGRLFPHLTVRGNLGYGARFAPRGAPGPDVAAVVDLLGIGALLDRRPGLLSGGERARVAIGRALMSRPRLLILDEPMAALDAARRAEILPWLERLRDQLGVPMLHISHDIADVARLATTLVLLENGRVRRAGPLAEVLADAGAATGLDPGDIGAVLSGHIAAPDSDGDDGLTRIATPAGDLLVGGIPGPPGQAVRLRVRAQDVIIAEGSLGRTSALNVLPAVVAAIEPAPPMVLVTLDLPGGGRLLARITQRSVDHLGLAPGRQVHAMIKSAALG